VIVVVGGSGSKSGKTAVLCRIIAATVEAHWLAVKITPHGHGVALDQAVITEEPNAGPQSDTARFLQAGACRAWWVRCAAEQIPGALRYIPEGNRIIESNTVLDTLKPDLFFFVEDPSASNWKLSARHITRADLIVKAGAADDAIELVRARL
jgi:hypothetical protein